MLEPVDHRDIIYTKTRPRMPSTDQSSRRQPHRKKCTRTVNCFIGRHPGTGSTFSRDPVSLRTIRRRLVKGHLGSRCSLRVLPLTLIHRHLQLEWCVSRGNWTAAEPTTSPGSISAVVTIVFVYGNPVENASILPLLYSDIPLPQLV
ncbi:uncharacterized protein TNCV_3182821 [Trichonephila clavipes]|uniref:Transposase Tc1-like domain-containing protein n=1 Tax=Trichonephila clavipes TaxID=2585209 RepID=A0A8X6SHA3_TRICX|nr:uncharacterized protein TNCV_3182821 [Trichonephila clavipes]